MKRTTLIFCLIIAVTCSTIAQDLKIIAANATLKDGSTFKGEFTTKRITGSTIFTEKLDLDPALVSRFNIYNFRPTVGEWLLWASQTGIDEHVTNFIENYGRMLDGDGASTESSSSLEKTPDRRGWERVSDILKNTPTITGFTKKMVAGIVGAKAAAEFFESFNQGNDR